MERPTPPASFRGTLVAIQTAPLARAPMEARPHARLVEQVGIEGDRYAAGLGAFSRWPGERRQLSIIAEEDLRQASERAGAPIAFAETRRNLLVRGVPLGDLVGVRFRVGEAVVEGVAPCQPCGYLDRVAERSDLRVALKGLGGLRARIVATGRAACGDAVVLLG
jgi:MOSC domain-containing protein YiiM